MESNGVNLAASLKKIPYLSSISQIAITHNINVWLVGGFLRDIYLKTNRVLCDFDFCVSKDTRSFVSEFAKKISSRYIVLDKAKETFRVVLRRAGRLYTYDFTRMRSNNFSQDLALRDFSINTLAINLRKRPYELIDYYQAKRDLRRRIIRVIRNRVIRQDPLRILRGFAFMANYDFDIEPQTLKIMSKNRYLIKKVSPERVKEEVFKIFTADSSFKIIKIMDKLRIIDEILPYINKARGVFQGAYHHLDVWQHSLETLRQFELLYQKKLAKHSDILNYLNEEIAGGRRRIQLVKLACLLHDIGKPFARKRLKKRTIFHTHEKIGRDLVEEISKHLRLSLREKEVLMKLTFWHLRPGYLADQANPTKRAIYRFFRDTQREGIAVILLSLADWRATRGPLTSAYKRRKHEKIMLGLIDNYFAEQKKKPLPKLVNGYDIMKKFKIEAGPLVGAILRKIKEEQALGKISTKREAYKITQRLIAKDKKLKNLLTPTKCK